MHCKARVADHQLQGGRLQEDLSQGHHQPGRRAADRHQQKGEQWCVWKPVFVGDAVCVEDCVWGMLCVGSLCV